MRKYILTRHSCIDSGDIVSQIIFVIEISIYLKRVIYHRDILLQLR